MDGASSAAATFAVTAWGTSSALVWNGTKLNLGSGPGWRIEQAPMAPAGLSMAKIQLYTVSKGKSFRPTLVQDGSAPRTWGIAPAPPSFLTFDMTSRGADRPIRRHGRSAVTKETQYTLSVTNGSVRPPRRPPSPSRCGATRSRPPGRALAVAWTSRRGGPIVTSGTAPRRGGARAPRSSPTRIAGARRRSPAETSEETDAVCTAPGRLASRRRCPSRASRTTPCSIGSARGRAPTTSLRRQEPCRAPRRHRVFCNSSRSSSMALTAARRATASRQCPFPRASGPMTPTAASWPTSSSPMASISRESHLLCMPRRADRDLVGRNDEVGVTASLRPVSYTCDVAITPAAFVTGVAPALTLHWDASDPRWSNATWVENALTFTWQVTGQVVVGQPTYSVRLLPRRADREAVGARHRRGQRPGRRELNFTMTLAGGFIPPADDRSGLPAPASSIGSVFPYVLGFSLSSEGTAITGALLTDRPVRPGPSSASAEGSSIHRSPGSMPFPVRRGQPAQSPCTAAASTSTTRWSRRRR